MKGKILIVVLIVVIASVSWFAYDLWKKKGAEKDPLKTPDSATPPLIPLPPASAPPATTPTVAAPPGNLYAVDSGPGQLAIEKRKKDLLSAGFSGEVVAQLNPNGEIFKGVEYFTPFLVQNISLSTQGAGAERMPYLLTTPQRNAIRAIADLKYTGAGYWQQLGRLVQACSNLRAATGVSTLAEDMYNTTNLNPIRNGAVWQFGGIKSGTDTGQNTKGSERMYNDYSTFAANWLTLAARAETLLTETAIDQLRATGWRFVGYDAPV